MNATQKRILSQLDLSGGPERVVNPFSGVKVELDARGVGLKREIRNYGVEVDGTVSGVISTSLVDREVDALLR